MGNALVLEGKLAGSPLLHALNGISPALFFTRALEVNPGFRVRSAVRRTYRYFEMAADAPFDSWIRCARLFAGRVDVRSLGRGLPTGEPQWRTIDHVRVLPRPGHLELEVAAPSFVWGMVRKIVGALRELDAGRLDESRLRAALAGERRLTLPMAEPEPLVLEDVSYPIDWTFSWAGPNRHQAEWWSNARTEAATRGMVANALASGATRTEGKLTDPFPTLELLDRAER